MKNHNLFCVNELIGDLHYGVIYYDYQKCSAISTNCFVTVNHQRDKEFEYKREFTENAVSHSKMMP